MISGPRTSIMWRGAHGCSRGTTPASIRQKLMRVIAGTRGYPGPPGDTAVNCPPSTAGPGLLKGLRCRACPAQLTESCWCLGLSVNPPHRPIARAARSASMSNRVQENGFSPFPLSEPRRDRTDVWADQGSRAWRVANRYEWLARYFRAADCLAAIICYWL